MIVRTSLSKVVFFLERATGFVVSTRRHLAVVLIALAAVVVNDSPLEYSCLTASVAIIYALIGN